MNHPFSYIAGVVLLVMLANASSAGMWEPNSHRRYHLVLAGDCSTVTPDQESWARDLAARFKRRGGLVTGSQVAPGCPGASLSINGEATATHRVFRVPDSGRYLVVSVPNSHTDSFAVDMAGKTIVEFGGIHTTSVHPHPSGAFAVVVYSHKRLIYGLPVLDSETNPTFSESSATWY